jgi:predicted nucleic acid-binding protein
VAASPIAADSSVIIAGLVAWHERHTPCAAALEGALARKALVIPVPALIESYAVLTKLPAQHRLAHADAFHLLRSSFSTARTAAPRTRDTWSMLRRLSVAPTGGNDVYDAVMMQVVVESGAKTLLTLRRRELERLGVTGVELLEPV